MSLPDLRKLLFFAVSSSKNLTPDCNIFEICVFDNFMLPDELLTKALQSLET